MLLAMAKVYRSFVVFIAMWNVYCQMASQNCPKIEFVGNISKDSVVVVEENCYVNISFHVNTNGCEDNTYQWLLKIVRVEGEIFVDECKIVLENKTCQQSMQGQQPCSCLREGEPVVQFRRTFNGLDYTVYDWMFTNQTTKAVTLHRMYFVIRKEKTKNNCKNTTESEVKVDGVCLCSCLQGVVVACVCVATIIAVTLGCIARRQCRSKGPSSNTTTHSQGVCSTDRLDGSDNEVYNHLSRR